LVNDQVFPTSFAQEQVKPQKGSVIVSDRCDASAEHTLRRELIPTQTTRRRAHPVHNC